jgi:hypothetical protein
MLPTHARGLQVSGVSTAVGLTLWILAFHVRLGVFGVLGMLLALYGIVSGAVILIQSPFPAWSKAHAQMSKPRILVLFLVMAATYAPSYPFLRQHVPSDWRFGIPLIGCVAMIAVWLWPVKPSPASTPNPPATSR